MARADRGRPGRVRPARGRSAGGRSGGGKSGGLRIVGGQLRGRRLKTPDGLETRPTSDRVRESIFDLLGPLTDRPRVLDLYAGSGALGIEALSRGGRSAVFVEHDRKALTVLRGNLADLGLDDRARVVAADVRRGWGRLTGEAGREGAAGVEGAAGPAAPNWPGAPFDLVLADPPYQSTDHEELVRRVAAVLAPGGRFILERAASGAAPVVSGLALTKDRRYGETRVSLYLYDSEDLP